MKYWLMILSLFICLRGEALEITSNSFPKEGYIPAKYTCDSLNISPSFYWEGAPHNTKSFVLIGDDPDAPFKTWVHWIVFNIPLEITSLEENFSQAESLPAGIIQGMNDFGKNGYGGPCPPAGKAHRYFFKLYALDTELSLNEEANKKDVLREMQGHILAETKIVGLYEH